MSLSWSLGVRSLSLAVRSLSLSLSLGVRSLFLSWSLGVRSLSLSWSLGVRSLSLSLSLGVRALSLSWSLGVRSLSLSWSLGVRSLLTSMVLTDSGERSVSQGLNGPCRIAGRNSYSILKDRTTKILLNINKLYCGLRTVHVQVHSKTVYTLYNLWTIVMSKSKFFGCLVYFF